MSNYERQSFGKKDDDEKKGGKQESKPEKEEKDNKPKPLDAEAMGMLKPL